MRLDLCFAESVQKLDLDFSESNQSFDADFGQIQHLTEYVGGDPYDGDYIITPQIDEQIMPTKNKIMLNDVTISAIPFFNVGNTSGGSTVYIAKEVR